MRLNTKAMRHLTADDWRVLTAVESGSKNHELVPTSLIERLARLRGGGSRVHRSISALAKAGLVGHTRDPRYDGWRLTYGGLDYLALHALATRGHVYSVGDRVGVGKESDIMLVADATGAQHVLKVHRLGRVSFRNVRNKRDYLRRGPRAAISSGGTSWMYLSRLAAAREFAFMMALRDAGFPVPRPLAQSRHTVLMALVDAPPLRQVSAVPDPAALYADLMALIMRLARHGLIHGDFNEFNILLKEGPFEDGEEEEEEEERKEKTVQPMDDTNNNNNSSGSSGSTSSPAPPQEQPNAIVTPVLIDFPQMLSMDHPNAEMYFDRDVQCVKTFFERRFRFVSEEPGPFFKNAKKLVGKGGAKRLDATVEVSGFTKKMARDLEAAIREKEEIAAQEGGVSEPDDEEDEDEDSEEEEEEKEEEDSDIDGHDGDDKEEKGVKRSGQASNGSFVPLFGDGGPGEAQDLCTEVASLDLEPASAAPT